MARRFGAHRVTVLRMDRFTDTRPPGPKPLVGTTRHLSKKRVENRWCPKRLVGPGRTASFRALIIPAALCWLVSRPRTLTVQLLRPRWWRRR
jgi:hypothetical protein